jgi:hypothetical protein
MSVQDTFRAVNTATVEVLRGKGNGGGDGDFAQCLLGAVRQSELPAAWWSDAFSNWRLEFALRADTTEAATAFRELFPNCPMDADALCMDYATRA